MGVKDNNTQYEPQTQWWRPGTGVASGGLAFQKLQCTAMQKQLLWPITALNTVENSQAKANDGYTPHAT